MWNTFYLNNTKGSGCVGGCNNNLVIHIEIQILRIVQFSNKIIEIKVELGP